ncbi:rab proteins geranylgeranyltransferase component A [Pseudovirgaria hyperparasitica]|uniref:Rab proteins geranylgeranyltransferase n=1 Tax=Pseudovirgaria hyperparasitica TaxID=470096 RepID=A0A6A6VU77_9PEZI|nr:rab proteins geranylgeranyltransferase component A [Pseudovirgaria hyperparasitica]KAF2753294.1 rab proteins geranylgeranyltransferase component A [Pseudovirgaria hyperparasitica]
METLHNTTWDVIISGTGLPQSLLALSLSRSDKRVLHIDQNEFYGGPEAAFSLQEAETWVRQLNDVSPSHTRTVYSSVSLQQPPNHDTDGPKLSFSRAYSLTLSPQIIYSRSALISALVDSKVYKQLDFLAVGSWWVFSSPEDAESVRAGSLLKVPNGREDIFTDSSLRSKDKRALMKFLRFMTDYEELHDIWEPYRDQPFSALLIENFKMSPKLQEPICALTLTSMTPNRTSTEYALPRIARHLRSVGVFGPGFGAIIPKWGGLSEVAQVGCRAGAVGGATYVLAKGIEGRQYKEPDSPDGPSDITLNLRGGESVSTKWLVGARDEALGQPSNSMQRSRDSAPGLLRSISIVSSPLRSLFPPLGEGSPVPAAAVVVFPTGSLTIEGISSADMPPVNIFVHSSETGECPTGQSVLYASISPVECDCEVILKQAVDTLLLASREEPQPKVLWSLHYKVNLPLPEVAEVDNGVRVTGNIVELPHTSLDLVFEDAVVDQVQVAWRHVTGQRNSEFLDFEDREGTNEDANND